MRAIFKPSYLSGSVYAPPSKSYAHRMMICAALADGYGTVSGISESEDMLATIDCIKALGADCRLTGGELDVKGIYSEDNGSDILRRSDQSIVFPCRESGSTLRFFIPIAAALFDSCIFKGTERLMERGIGVYEHIFEKQKISCRMVSDGIYINGRIKSGVYEIPGNISSQFVSGLLFALPLLDGQSIIRVLPPVESRAYIDITIQVLRKYGITVEEPEPNTFAVAGGQHYHHTYANVEGDWSNAANLFALNAVGVGKSIEISGLSDKSLQGDRICKEYFRELDNKGSVTDISNCPDLGPILFAVAAAKHGGTFTGTRRLRIKESDRATAMADELEKFGIKATVEENSVTVNAGELHSPRSVLCGHNDHRIVMALSVLACIVGGEISGAEAVKKSFPDFFEVLKALGAEVELKDEI
ncbi:MAG: 3-phosphoshikimate 1-carboxyvinyltransferase [Eubacteriales bacterium]|nr:3-phosphoshikimate 1-carboxyvinyltransferase [Eubacteriales bacterium]